jgi:hypothetical protein
MISKIRFTSKEEVDKHIPPSNLTPSPLAGDITITLRGSNLRNTVKMKTLLCAMIPVIVAFV